MLHHVCGQEMPGIKLKIAPANRHKRRFENSPETNSVQQG
jgi:hypothetical protein